MKIIALALLAFAGGCAAQTFSFVAARQVCIGASMAYPLYADMARVYVPCSVPVSGNGIAFRNSDTYGVMVLDNADIRREFAWGAFSESPLIGIAGASEQLVTISKNGWWMKWDKGQAFTVTGVKQSILTLQEQFWLTKGSIDLLSQSVAVRDIPSTRDIDIFIGVLTNPDDDPHGYLAADERFIYGSSGYQPLAIHKNASLFAYGARYKTVVYDSSQNLVAQLSNDLIGCPGYPESDGFTLLRTCPLLTGGGVLITPVSSLNDESSVFVEDYGASYATHGKLGENRYLFYGTNGGKVCALRSDASFSRVQCIDLYDYVSTTGGRVEPGSSYREVRNGEFVRLFPTDLRVHAIKTVTVGNEMRIFVRTRPRFYDVRGAWSPHLFMFTFK